MFKRYFSGFALVSVLSVFMLMDWSYGAERRKIAPPRPSTAHAGKIRDDMNKGCVRRVKESGKLKRGYLEFAEKECKACVDGLMKKGGELRSGIILNDPQTMGVTIGQKTDECAKKALVNATKAPARPSSPPPPARK